MQRTIENKNNVIESNILTKKLHEAIFAGDVDEVSTNRARYTRSYLQ